MATETNSRDRVLRRLWARLLVWGIFFGALYVLSSFFLLIFLTFIFAYLQSHAVDKLAEKIPVRALRVTLVGLLFLGILVGLGAYIVPQVKHQAETFAAHVPQHLKELDNQLRDFATSNPVLANSFHWDTNSEGDSLATTLLEGMFSPKSASPQGAINLVRSLGGSVVAVGSAFFLSLILSFLIVLDLPSLIASVRSLEKTKLRFVYQEVAPSILTFGQVLGRAFEAQSLIALMNMLLTGIGMALLGIHDNFAFLCLMVFLCSFIPVAGVFFSSVPICLIALQQGGLWLAVLAIGMVLFVHFIEAYIINPRIFGRHLHINPVLVLMILTIGGKLFGVWGLLLGLPLCTYVFGHAIQLPKSQVQDSE